MWKVMKLQLSRIEREYVLRELLAAKPSLEILNCGTIFLIDPSQWHSDVFGTHIQLEPSVNLPKTSCSLFFSVRGRSYTAVIQIEKQDTGSRFVLPDAISKHDQSVSVSGVTSCRLLPAKGVPTEARALSEFPTDTLSLLPAVDNPVLSLILQKLVSRAFPTGSARDQLAAHSPVQIRAACYLEAVRSAAVAVPTIKERAHLLHVDHQWLLLGSRGELSDLKNAGNQLELQFSNRFIQCPIPFVSMISDRSTTLSVFDMGAACEEDKRYLFEKIYATPYL